jgi:cyclophilin family peptidyl-prolyl cis-trans isomerase
MPTGDDRLKAFDKVKEGAIRAELEIENRGKMVLELYPKAAPKTVEHVVSLIKQGFYDGIKFHRVEPGFVVQGGDPQSKNLSPEEFSANQVGSHGSGKNVPLEATLPHLPNSVGLARAQDPNSGDSQFYINLKDNGDALDGGYCVFGMVVEGADIAPKIEVGDKIKSFKLQ